MTDGAGSQHPGESQLLLFAESAGNYYQVPVAAFERVRVPEEQ